LPLSIEIVSIDKRDFSRAACNLKTSSTDDTIDKTIMNSQILTDNTLLSLTMGIDKSAERGSICPQGGLFKMTPASHERMDLRMVLLIQDDAAVNFVS
jgi:hypothetical protein